MHGNCERVRAISIKDTPTCFETYSSQYNKIWKFQLDLDTAEIHCSFVLLL